MWKLSSFSTSYPVPTRFWGWRTISPCRRSIKLKERCFGSCGALSKSISAAARYSVKDGTESRIEIVILFETSAELRTDVKLLLGGKRYMTTTFLGEREMLYINQASLSTNQASGVSTQTLVDFCVQKGFFHIIAAGRIGIFHTRSPSRTLWIWYIRLILFPRFSNRYKCSEISVVALWNVGITEDRKKQNSHTKSKTSAFSSRRTG